MSVVEFKNISVLFGEDPPSALKLLDEGESAESIQEKTGHVVGVYNASLEVNDGEICVLMGLSGSGKSTFCTRAMPIFR